MITSAVTQIPQIKDTLRKGERKEQKMNQKKTTKILRR